MTLKLMGKKKGMTRIFDEQGNLVVCTLIAAEPNIVSQVKTQEKDGYDAIQLGAEKVLSSKTKNVKKPLRGHFAKAKVEARKHLIESRLSVKEGSASPYALGQEIGLEYFEGCVYIDVEATSKGKGYQGVIKRHHFAGGPASHGSGFHRHGGSTGMRTSPGRCLPGQKKAGRMGAERVTIQNLRIVKIDSAKQVIFVEGAVPGAQGALVYMTKAVKKTGEKNKRK